MMMVMVMMMNDETHVATLYSPIEDWVFLDQVRSDQVSKDSQPVVDRHHDRVRQRGEDPAVVQHSSSLGEVSTLLVTSILLKL